VILVLVDFFVLSDILTHIAYVLVAIVVARLFELQLLYRIIIGVCTWFAVVACHYVFWRSFVQTFVNKVISPDKYKEGARGLVGLEGKIEEAEGRKMLRLKGDLWQCSNSDEFKDGDNVKVAEETDGLLTVEPIERSQ
jgi:membrane protein implicated in regulation of membrane protease activity